MKEFFEEYGKSIITGIIVFLVLGVVLGPFIAMAQWHYISVPANGPQAVIDSLPVNETGDAYLTTKTASYFNGWAFLWKQSYVYGFVLEVAAIVLYFAIGLGTPGKNSAKMLKSKTKGIEGNLENSRFLTDKEKDDLFPKKKYNSLDSEQKDGIPVYAVYNQKKKDMDINLNIPCPAVKSENGKLRVAVSYGEGAGEGSASVLSIDSVSCRVSQADANIRLNLKCPVIGSSKPNKIRVRIKYGPEKQEASAEYIRKDAGICQMEPLDPVLNLSIRCPVGVSGARKIKFKPITYSNVNAKKAVQVDYLSTNADTCEINPLDPEIQLSVPCPTDPSRLEIKGSGIVSVGEIFDPVTCKRTFDIHANAPTVNIPCIDVVTGVTWDGTDCKAITVNLCTGKEASYIVFTSVAHTGGC